MKNVLLRFAFLASTSALFSAQSPETQKPLLIWSSRNASAYIQLKETFNPEIQRACSHHTLIVTDREKTLSVDTVFSPSTIQEPPTIANIHLESIMSFKETNQPSEELSHNMISYLPLRSADVLGAKICEQLSKQLNTSSRHVAPLLVWQGVAIDPLLTYQTWEPGKEFLIVENGLLQPEDITQKITNPDQLLRASEWHKTIPAPSHRILFLNALSRAQMPSNASSVKHKIFLMYASDLNYLSREALQTFRTYDWNVVVLGTSHSDQAATVDLFNLFGVQFMYLNCINGTQPEIQQRVVQFYMDKLLAQRLNN